MKPSALSLTVAALVAAVSFAPRVASAQTVLYSDDFEINSSANYTVRAIDRGNNGDHNVFFATNYTLTTFPRFGANPNIPLAPSGAGGRGVKMFVNKRDTTAQTAAINLYPIVAQPFTNDYAMKVDMFLGYNGPVAGGTGSTEYGLVGINHSGAFTNWQDSGSTSDGVWFGVTGEGQDTLDYRAYVGDGVSSFQLFTSFNGGLLDRDSNGTAESEVFYGSDAPTAPLWLMFPTNTVGESPGVPGKQWVRVEVRQRTNDVGQYLTTWLMNNFVIARHTNVSLIAGVANQGTVMIGNQDTYASIASPAVDNYVIFDNLRVVDLQGVADLPEVSIEVVDDTATEAPAGDNAVFKVTRKGSTAGPLTVNYVARGTATGGSDYTALPGSITFQPGDAETNITVTPLNDNLGEIAEAVILGLNTTANYEVFDSWASITINDDNDKPLAAVTTFRSVAYEANTNSYGHLYVYLSTPPAADVTVNYTLSGSAVNGTHYESLPGTITITAGTTTNELFVRPINGTDTVSNRTVTVTLTTGAAYDLGTPVASTVTIFNDDLPAATGTLYSDNFDTDSALSWNIFMSTNNCSADFAFDYGLNLGIPPAPHSAGGTTLGLRMRANSPLLGQATTTAQFPGITTSPKNQNFTGDYRIRFDAWLNFPGPFPNSGTGSTQLGSFGITSGTKVQWSGFSTSSPDAVFFGMTGDGDSGQDWRIFTNIVRIVPAQPGVYAAGTVGDGNNTEAYYSVFGRMTAPPAQLTLFPSQTGRTAVGAAGMEWRDVVITKLGSTVIWTVDGVKIGTVNSAKYGVNLSTNLFLGTADVNGTQTTSLLDATLCAIYDNLVVESLPAPTQPGITGIVITGGNVQIDFTNSVSDIPDLFTLRTATTVSGPYTYQAATVTQVAPGSFRAVAPYAAIAQRYYRILR